MTFAHFSVDLLHPSLGFPGHLLVRGSVHAQRHLQPFKSYRNALIIRAPECSMGAEARAELTPYNLEFDRRCDFATHAILQDQPVSTNCSQLTQLSS